MAGISYDIATGKIDTEDTKTLRVVAKDTNGNKLALDSITFEIALGGTTTTYTKSDFSESNKEYTTKHDFDDGPGVAEIDVTVVDDPNLDTERETDDEYVYE